METEISDDTPCSSIAVDSIIRIGYAGFVWGMCSGPYDAKKIGLTGIPRASFVAKSVGTYGLQCDSGWKSLCGGAIKGLYKYNNLVYTGLFAGIFSFTSCGLQRYRGEKDWVNALIAGAVAGAAVGAGTRNWKHVAGLASVVSAVLSAAGDS